MPPTLAAVRSYQVADAVRAELVDALGERFVFETAAGTVTPKNEREELALEHLISIGYAKPVGPQKPAKNAAKAPED